MWTKEISKCTELYAHTRRDAIPDSQGTLKSGHVSVDTMKLWCIPYTQVLTIPITWERFIQKTASPKESWRQLVSMLRTLGISFVSQVFHLGEARARQPGDLGMLLLGHYFDLENLKTESYIYTQKRNMEFNWRSYFSLGKPAHMEQYAAVLEQTGPSADYTWIKVAERGKELGRGEIWPCSHYNAPAPPCHRKKPHNHFHPSQSYTSSSANRFHFNTD